MVIIEAAPLAPIINLMVQKDLQQKPAE